MPYATSFGHYEFSENEQFFNWAEENLVGFEWRECEESSHAYYKGEFIGGWGGDTRDYFLVYSDTLSRLLRKQRHDAAFEREERRMQGE